MKNNIAPCVIRFYKALSELIRLICKQGKPQELSFHPSFKLCIVYLAAALLSTGSGLTGFAELVVVCSCEGRDEDTPRDPFQIHIPRPRSNRLGTGGEDFSDVLVQTQLLPEGEIWRVFPERTVLA